MIARIRSLGARRIAVVVLAAGLVGVVAVPTILAASVAPASAPSIVADLDQLAAPRQAARFGRIVRGEATILKPDNTTMTVHFERGELTAASATSVTVKGADGVSTTFAIGSDTRIRSQGKAIEAGALKSGDLVLAVGTASSSGYDALLIRVRAPKPAP
jgi:hypothetical protein